MKSFGTIAELSKNAKKSAGTLNNDTLLLWWCTSARIKKSF